MTTARQERKRRARFLIVAACIFGPASGASLLYGATTEQIVVDTRTGLAISGFDPVAYFTDGDAQQGEAEHEFRFLGATWRFRNIGNRAAFAGNPEIYMPRYGGHDPVAIARGAAVAGHPQVWLVHRDRLYLFYDAAAKVAFAGDPERIIETAERRWAEVQRVLAR